MIPPAHENAAHNRSPQEIVCGNPEKFRFPLPRCIGAVDLRPGTHGQFR